jgi:hypothetical protein
MSGVRSSPTAESTWANLCTEASGDSVTEIQTYSKTHPGAGAVRRPSLMATSSACPAKGEGATMPRVGLGGMVRLWWGKVRRAVLGRVFPGYIRRRHALRRGQCVRCGACCQLGIVCPSLGADDSGLAMCAKYDSKRDLNCSVFPITQSDLRDRDMILPGTPCGYWFPDHADRPAAKRRSPTKR